MTISEANDLLINGDGIIVTHFNVNNLQYEDTTFDSLEKSAVVIVVTKGSAEVEIDYKLQKIDADNNNLVLIGKFNRIDKITVRNNYEAISLVVSQKFLSALVPFRNNNDEKVKDAYIEMPISNFIAMRDKPVFHLTIQQKDMVVSLLQKVEHNISRKKDLLRLQLVYVAVVECIMEIMNIIIPTIQHLKTLRNKKDRKMDLVRDFSRLIYRDFKSHHSVSYYADLLCVSAQYLSKATRVILGVSASRVIEDMIISEAHVLLRTPNTSVQQVAIQLGFTDQSAFGKFFKKNTGKSPLNYKKTS